MYKAKDLGICFLDPKNTKLLVIPKIKMSLLSLMGLPVSRDFTVAFPLYRMLIEVSYHYIYLSEVE